MKAEGWKFPPVREAEAMFEADTAPDWAEGWCIIHCRIIDGTHVQYGRISTFSVTAVQ